MENTTLGEASASILLAESSDGQSAAALIWWMALSGDVTEEVLIGAMRTCVNKAESLSENDRWIAATGLEHIRKSRPPWWCEQLEFCVKNDTINRPASASVAWRRASPQLLRTSRNSYFKGAGGYSEKRLRQSK